jgi:phage shock protein C
MNETSPGCPRCEGHQGYESSFCPTCGARLSGKPRQLRRSRSQGQVLGVCGGLAEYLDTDPTLTRVLFLVLTLFSGIFPGVVLYLLMALVVPAD